MTTIDGQIKAISIKQPYVDLILDGIKTLEIRTWQTTHRGRIYIHSCKKPDFGTRYCGYILGYVDITDIRHFFPNDIMRSCIPYRPNNHAWILDNPVKIEPIPYKGRQGIFGINLEE